MKSKIKAISFTVLCALALTGCGTNTKKTEDTSIEISSSFEASSETQSSAEASSQLIPTSAEASLSVESTAEILSSVTSEEKSSNEASSQSSIEASSQSSEAQSSIQESSSVISQSSAEASSSNIESSQSSASQSSAETQSSQSTSSSTDIDEGITVTKAVGANQCAYVEFNVLNSEATSNYKVSYSQNNSTFTKIDDELIRKNGTTCRADIVGLKVGTYQIKVENLNTGAYSIKTVSVAEQDKSGYAHYGYSNGVGAYKDDGTLKDNAVVVYVNETNKNTVKAKINGTTYTGLANILSNAKDEKYPVNIRILGTVGAATWSKDSPDVSKYSTATTSTVQGINGEYLALQNYDESAIIKGGFNELDESVYPKLNGLTNKIKYDSDKTEFDSYYNMLDIKGAQNVTVEGIGNDATLDQWGFTWKSDCKSIEVRNLTFNNYTEDACSFEGSGDDNNLTTLSSFTSTRYWIHHNTFNKGRNYWDVCSEQDKGDGDGATDFKRCAYVTVSYNHYYKNHKTGLVGGGDTQKTAAITFHHNFYDQNQSRLPFARQANMHMYNNYYYASSGTNMQIYAGAYAFIENCYFKNTKNTFSFKTSDGKVPAVKSFNNIFDGTTSSGATIVTDRDTAVSNGCLYGQTFDTDSSIFYYDSENHCSDVDIMNDVEDVPEIVMAYAGSGDGYYNQLVRESADELNNAKNKAITDLNNLITSTGTYYEIYQSKKNECDAIITKYTQLINEAQKSKTVTQLYAEAIKEFENLTKASYAVTFVVDGVTYQTVTAYQNEDVEFPEAPTKSGQYFAYWVDENNKKFSGSTSKDIVLTAVFASTKTYSQLASDTNNVVALDFDSSTADAKLGDKNLNTTAVFGGTNGNDSSLCYGIYTGSAIQTVDNNAEAAAIIGLTLGQEYNSGIITGYVELSTNGNIGGNWKLLSFYNNEKEVISFGFDGNGSKNWAYTTDGKNWITFNTTLGGKANTKYSIYYQFDLDNGTVTLYINGTQYLNCVSCGVNSISYFQTMTNSKGTGNSARNITLDNIAIIKED